MAVFFVNSIAFRENYDEILRCLDESTSALPEVTLLACAKFIELVGEEASNISHRAAASAGEAGRLIVRVYGTSTDVSFRGRCLDVIDRMLAFQTMELPEALEAYER
jgi:phosphate uptake regulator